MIEILHNGQVVAQALTENDAIRWVELVTGQTIGHAIARDGFTIRQAEETEATADLPQLE
jgi:desulfoferrodoxin (superoxide reductase-like protein)